MAEAFYQLKRGNVEVVTRGLLTIEEYGLFCCLASIVNPVNGYWLGNFSMLAEQFNIDRDKARYVCNKLKRLKQIYFETAHGKRTKTRFFVLGLEMVKDGAGQKRFVTPDYIMHITKTSEVGSHFPKSKAPLNHDISSNCEKSPARNSGVPYIEKEKEKENENESGHIKVLSRETYEELLKAMSRSELEKYCEVNGYKLPLQT